MAHNIWGKSVPDLKGKTTRTKPIPVAGDLVHMPEDMVKLHKYIYLTSYLFFVNSIPLFLTLSRKICFIDVKYLANRKLESIFKAFKEI